MLLFVKIITKKDSAKEESSFAVVDDLSQKSQDNNAGGDGKEREQLRLIAKGIDVYSE